MISLSLSVYLYIFITQYSIPSLLTFSSYFIAY